ncbi:MAG: GNAT family N-acetyltransferase [Thermoplasmata archaeon]|nr:GNAT family N-acetyltransferase [Thermoplasmata archaeon]
MTEIHVDNAPDIPGLRFRNYRGEEDLPLMHDVSEREKLATDDDYFESLDDFKTSYKNLLNCDPFKQVLIAEIDDQVIAYCRNWWSQKQQGGYNYNHFTILAPEWYGQGIRNAMSRWNEKVLREFAKAHPETETRTYQAWALDTEKDWISVLKSEGYEIVRYGFEMVRPLNIEIHDIPLPDGLEIRPARPEDYRKIWDADVEAHKDGWEPVVITEEFYKNWLASDSFQPDIWQVAWDGDEVAGAVQNFISEESNIQYNRKRGYTENIHVGRKWRGKGLAKALIARSFKIIKERGMEEACLGVDADNPTGALSLYKGMGFEVDKTFHTYRKPVFED